MRRLGDAAVVFDAVTWQTHLLPPAAAAVADLIDELAQDGVLSSERLFGALREELDLDPEAREIQELLRMFGEIGMLDT